MLTEVAASREQTGPQAPKASVHRGHSEGTWLPCCEWTRLQAVLTALIEFKYFCEGQRDGQGPWALTLPQVGAIWAPGSFLSTSFNSRESCKEPFPWASSHGTGTVGAEEQEALKERALLSEFRKPPKDI